MVIQLDAERCDQHNRRRDPKKNRRYEQIQQALAESLIKRKTTVSREQKRCIENMERFRFPYHNIRQLRRQIDTDFFRIAIFQQTVAQLRMKIAQDHALLTVCVNLAAELFLSHFHAHLMCYNILVRPLVHLQLQAFHRVFTVNQKHLSWRKETRKRLLKKPGYNACQRKVHECHADHRQNVRQVAPQQDNLQIHQRIGTECRHHLGIDDAASLHVADLHAAVNVHENQKKNAVDHDDNLISLIPERLQPQVARIVSVPEHRKNSAFQKHNRRDRQDTHQMFVLFPVFIVHQSLPLFLPLP